MNLNEQNPMVAFARLTKVDEQRRLVFGRAAQEFPDRSDELFDYEGSKPYFEAWSKSQLEASLGKSAGNVRGMHGKIAAGILTPENGIIFNDAEKAIDVVAHVTDDQEWKKVMTGTYTGFSIGGKYVSKGKPDSNGVTPYVADPSEISLVDRPCGKTSTFFDVIKADGTTEKVEAKGAAAEDPKPADEPAAKTDPAPVEKAKLVRADGVDLAIEVEKASLPKPGGTFEHEGRTYSLVKVEDGTATVELVYEVTGSPVDIADFAKALTESGLAISDATALIRKAHPSAEQLDAGVTELAKAESVDLEKATPENKAELRKRVKQQLLDAAAARDAEAAGFVKAVLDKTAPTYGAKVFADEKNRRYPIDSPDQIQAAWKYIHLPIGKLSDDERAAIKTRIEAAAKERNVQLVKVDGEFVKALSAETERLHKAAGKTEPDDALAKQAGVNVLRKGLATCGQFAYMLDSLCQLAEAIELEALAEGDGSTIADDVYAHIVGLGQCLADLIGEEIREESTGSDNGVHGQMVQLSEGVKGLLKRLGAEPVEKGSYTAVHVARVQKLHDMSVKMGGKCAAPAEKTAATDLQKMVQDAGGLEKVVSDAVSKAVGPVQEALEKANARIETLEAQPMPTKVQLALLTKPVTKAEDGRTLLPAAQKFEPVRDSDGKINVVATVIKAQQTGNVDALSQFIDPDTGVQK